MVDALLESGALNDTDTLLDPGCGTGSLIQAVYRWADRNDKKPPRITEIELDPQRFSTAATSCDREGTAIINEDFLTWRGESFDLILGNPPYVPITQLTGPEKKRYRERFVTARGRFDLYMLFFERALELLKPTGRLVFVTREKFLYVQAAEELRTLLARRGVRSIQLLRERSFGGLTTYPTITMVGPRSRNRARISARDGERREVNLPSDGRSWASAIWGSGSRGVRSDTQLRELSLRISCGVATGADSVFVVSRETLSQSLRQYAVPTVSGRELGLWDSGVPSTSMMLTPYDQEGALVEEDRRLALFRYLTEPNRREKLLARTCVPRKPWYAFHETPPQQIWKPKILWRDVSTSLRFVVDHDGQLVPRHTVYYLVPRPGVDLEDLAGYLNGPDVAEWLHANCQRASNGYLRLQTHVLAHLPIPVGLARTWTGVLKNGQGGSAVSNSS